MGTDMQGIGKLAGPGKLPGFGQICPHPTHLTEAGKMFFFQAMERGRVWGTNCHLRHVARGFSNLRGMLASKQWKLMVVSADYPSSADPS